MKTISEAREMILQNKNKGINCPCCGQHVKEYKRKLNSGMARDLISLYRKKQEWNHREEFSKSRGKEISKLKYWGLVEEKINTNTSKRTSGIWRITSKGIAFVENRMPIEKYVYIYNGYANGFSEEEISITDALKDYFNYNELMKC